MVSYVALGDSITAARYDNDGGYVTRYSDVLAADLDVSVEPQNFAVGGLRSAGLLASLRNDEAVRAAVASADVLTVYIGMNDFMLPAYDHVAGSCGGIDNQDCLRNAYDEFRANLQSALDEVALLNQDPRLLLRLCDIYYPTTGDAAAAQFETVLGPFLQSMNEAIHFEGAKRGVAVAAVFTAFNGPTGTEDPFAEGLLRDDGVHPSSTGFEQIATALRDTGYAPLVPVHGTGDADCDGIVSASDASLILQRVALLIDALDCEDAADVDGSGAVTPIDSTLVLQVVAGLVPNLTA